MSWVDDNLRRNAASIERLLAERARLLAFLRRPPPPPKRARNATHEDYVRRFLSLIERTPGCWKWNGYVFYPKKAAPRGKFYYLDRTWFAHRFAWFHFKAQDPAGLCVCHACDNSLCVNPDHLFLGSQQINVADMDRKGRRVIARGERNGAAKLTADQVREIRRLHADGASLGEVAARYGIERTSVRDIVNRKNWRHVA